VRTDSTAFQMGHFAELRTARGKGVGVIHPSLIARGPERNLTLGPDTFLARASVKVSLECYRRRQAIFIQGDLADAVFRVQKGQVKLTVASSEGKEAIVGLLGTGDFFGEECLGGQPLRLSTATAIDDTTVLRLGKRAVARLLHTDQRFSELFTANLLSRNIRFEADLVDQLFNSAEMRLARVLLQLARLGRKGQRNAVIPKVSQETLAEMVGTTRSRISHFMNKFRKLGYIDYNGDIRVHSSLFNILRTAGSGESMVLDD
jgi:CRP/FNR family transcriptional regulator, cyclic AMP receptor protein